jgi:dienelactone hydrolase
VAWLSVTPTDALVDEPRHIVAGGLQPGERIELSAVTVRGPGVVWRSRAHFAADARGEVDLARDAPLAGSYEGVSAMGLLWSQAPEGPSTDWARRDVFASGPGASIVTELALHRLPEGGERLATQRLVQRLAATGVTRQEVREQVGEERLVGTLYRPAGPGPHPAVLVLNGSGGGINEPRAALYASRGWAALALGYFKAPGLSAYISHTRLELFEAALQWMHRQLQPAHGMVALSGQSRGGELVLLLGSLFPELVGAVVAYVPSACVHPAQNACDPSLGRESAAWLWRGQPFADLWAGNRTASWAPWDEGPEPRRHTAAILTALEDEQAVARARIPVERIRGPVMLLSGSDDGSWPSSVFGRMVAQRLAAHGHPWPVQHLDFEGAGHSILFPHVPTTQLTYAHPVSGRLSTTGGTPAANARADEASWAGVQRFLGEALAARARTHDLRGVPR